MESVYIIRYGEINTKGSNRIFFERKLYDNIKLCLSYYNIPYSKLVRVHNRMYLYSDANCSCLHRVFGISSLSKAVVLESSLTKIRSFLLTYLPQQAYSTFRITAKKLDDQTITIPSPELEQQLGGFVLEHFPMKKVLLKNSDLNLQFEFFQGKAYLFTSVILGFDGLPVGSEGTVCVLLDGSDSVIAALLMMKRGCSCIFYQEKQLDTTLLQHYCFGKFIVASPQQTLGDFIKQHACQALVVADNFHDLRVHPFSGFTLRPLIGFNEEELVVVKQSFM